MSGVRPCSFHCFHGDDDDAAAAVVAVVVAVVAVVAAVVAVVVVVVADGGAFWMRMRRCLELRKNTPREWLSA